MQTIFCRRCGTTNSEKNFNIQKKNHPKKYVFIRKSTRFTCHENNRCFFSFWQIISYCGDSTISFPLSMSFIETAGKMIEFCFDSTWIRDHQFERVSPKIGKFTFLTYFHKILKIYQCKSIIYEEYPKYHKIQIS